MTDSKLPPPAYFEELAAMQLLVPRAKVLAALADAYGQPGAAVPLVKPVEIAINHYSEALAMHTPCPAAPAAGAPQGEYPPLPQSVGDVTDFGDGKVDIDWGHPAPAGGTRLYSAKQMRAYVDADRAARAEQPATVSGPVLDVRAIAAAVCQRVAELPDRNSPEDWPEAMLVTGQELIDVVTCELEQAQAAPAVEAPAAKPGGMSTVPFDLIAAACSAIDKKRDAPKTLAELRRYTTGDLSRALEVPAAPGAVLDLPSGAAPLGTYRNVDDGATFAWGRCDDGYFLLDQFGWATWPTREGFSRALLRAAAPQAPAAPTEPGRLDDGMQIRCRKCGEQATIAYNSARIVTHNKHTGKPRDERDIDSDPEGKLMVAPGALHSAVLAAPAASAVDAFTHAELLEIKRAVEEFADCNETDVGYALLLRAAQAGYLECTQFHVLNQSALDLDTVAAAQAKEGGAA